MTALNLLQIVCKLYYNKAGIAGNSDGQTICSVVPRATLSLLECGGNRMKWIKSEVGKPDCWSFRSETFLVPEEEEKINYF